MKVLSVLGATLATAVLAWALFAGGGKGHSALGTGDPLKAPVKPTLPPGTSAEQVQVLIQQYEKAVTVFRKLYEAAKTEVEQAKLEPLCPDPDSYSALLLEIAEKNPKAPAAIDALLWVVRGGGKPSVKAKSILIHDHCLNPKDRPALHDAST